MQRTAKLFMNNRSQSVRLPKEFQFKTSQVYIRKQGDEVVLSSHPDNWNDYFASAPIASEHFMEGIDDLPAQDRDI